MPAGFSLGQLSFASLVGLALFPLGDIANLSLVELIRLLVITVGIIWLLLKRSPLLAHRPEGEFSYEGVLVVLIFIFILTQFNQSDRGDEICRVLKIGLVILAFTGAMASYRSRFTFSRLDWIVLVASLLAFISLFILDIYSLLDIESRWIDPLFVFGVVVVYFAVDRCIKAQPVRRPGAGLLVVATIVFALIDAMGVWRMGTTFYHVRQAIENFRLGYYEEARNHAITLTPLNSGLQVDAWSIERVIEEMFVRCMESDVEAYATIGSIADQKYLWYLSARAYRKLYEVNPDYPAICTRLGNALFEQGYRSQALGMYHQGLGQANVDLEDYLAMGTALARNGAWGEANQVLDIAIGMYGFEERSASRTWSGEEVLKVRLDDLLPEVLWPYIRKVTLFEVVKLLENRGWKVFHPGMEIGDTGIIAPTDIVATSGGGQSYRQEAILVDDQQVSMQYNGYNVVVIDSHTGNVEDIMNFDGWSRANALLEMGDFIDDLPQGKVVVMTVHIDAPSGWTEYLKWALEHVGIERFPGSGWSYVAIGVKGAPSGTAIEAQGLIEHDGRALVVVGVLRGNMPDGVSPSSDEFMAELKKAASEAPGRIAVFIPRLDPKVEVVVLRQ